MNITCTVVVLLLILLKSGDVRTNIVHVKIASAVPPRDVKVDNQGETR